MTDWHWKQRKTAQRTSYSALKKSNLEKEPGMQLSAKQEMQHWM